MEEDQNPEEERIEILTKKKTEKKETLSFAKLLGREERREEER